MAARSAIQFRLLLWLSFRTALPVASRRARRLLLAAVAAAAIAIGAGAGLLLRSATVGIAAAADPSLVVEWVHAVAFLAWLLFLVAGLFGGGEPFDASRLLHLPVNHRTLLAARIGGQVFDRGALYLALAAGLLAGLPGSPAETAGRAAAAVLLLLHGLLAGECVRLLFAHLHRARRFREGAIVFAGLLAGALFLSLQALFETGSPEGALHRLLQSRPSRALFLLPSSWAAGVIAPNPDSGALLLFGFGFLPLTAGIAALAAELSARAATAELPSPRPRAGAPRPEVGDRSARPGRRLLPEEVRAEAAKDLALLRRDPLLKARLILGAGLFLVPLTAAAVRAADRGHPPSLLLTVFSFALLGIESFLVLNLYGLDGAGFLHGRRTAASPRRIVLGKQLAALAAWGPANLLLLAAAAGTLALFGRPAPGFALRAAEGVAALLALVGAGAVVSGFAPIATRGGGPGALTRTQSVRAGCLGQLVRLALSVPAWLVTIPVALLPRILPPVPGGLFAVCYGALVFTAGGRLGARILARRGERIAAALAKGGG